MDKIIVEIGDKKVSFDEFINIFFSLLFGYFLVDKVADVKFSKSDIEKYSKVMVDITLEWVIMKFSIMELLKKKGVSFEIPKMFNEGKTLESIIISNLSLMGDKECREYINSSILQENIDTQNAITDYIEKFLMKEGVLSYEKLEDYYYDSFKGFLLLSFLFVSIPKILKPKEKEEIKDKMKTENPVEMEKFYEKDPNKIVYYYDNINVFEYFTSSEDFENRKMYALYDVLSGVGIDPDNMVLDESIKGEIITIPSQNRENFYKFTQIEYDKPVFSDKIYEYMREYVFDQLYDEVFEKLYDEAIDSIKIKYYDKNIEEIEKFLRPISRKWFEDISKLSF